MASDEPELARLALRRFVSRSSDATERLAAELARELEPGTVIALDGELGAGKTCFVRGLARGLESTVGVASPTYTLMHEYPGRIALYHFDAWMQGREEAFLAGGGAEWFSSGGVAVVEWASRVAHHLPEPRFAIALLHTRDPNRREIRLDVLARDLRAGAAERLAALGRRLEAPEGVDEQPLASP